MRRGNLREKTLSGCTANGWLKEQDEQFFHNGIGALEKRQCRCISVAGHYVEK